MKKIYKKGDFINMNIFTDTTRQSLTEEELTFQKKYGDKGIEIVPPFIAFQNGDYDYKKRKELLKNLSAGIYQNEDISLFERLTNPSSGGNPSSGSMSSRFM